MKRNMVALLAFLSLPIAVMAEDYTNVVGALTTGVTEAKVQMWIVIGAGAAVFAVFLGLSMIKRGARSMIGR